jgi:hypothetical protein
MAVGTTVRPTVILGRASFGEDVRLTTTGGAQEEGKGVSDAAAAAHVSTTGERAVSDRGAGRNIRREFEEVCRRVE